MDHTESSRGDELWVPQSTQADAEETTFVHHFGNSVRLNQVIFQSGTAGGNVLTRVQLVAAMKLHKEIESREATNEDRTITFMDLCIFAVGSCVSAIPTE